MSGDETLLIKKAQNGSISAFEDLICAYEKRIYNFCYRMTNNREDAEDLSQEVFLKAYKNIRSFKGNSRFSTWIYRIAYNTCIDRFRKNKKGFLTFTINNDEEGREMDIPCTEPTPEERVIDREGIRAIQECIAMLKPDYKTVIILRDIQNHTYQEIAEILHIPMGTVKSHISRARASLRELLVARETAAVKGVE